MSEFTNRKEAIPKSKKVSSRTHENYEIKDIIEILQHMTYVQPGPVISFQPTLRDIKLIEWYISAWNSVLCFDVSER